MRIAILADVHAHLSALADAHGRRGERVYHAGELIAGAIAELDLRQIEITRRLTPAQRCQEGLSMIRLAEQVGAYRLRKRRPELSEAEALRIVRSAR